MQKPFINGQYTGIMSWTLAMVNAFYHPYIGGTEKHMYELSRRLARKHNVVVITSRLENTPQYEEIDGVKIHRLDARFYRLPHLYPPPMVVSRGVEREMERLHREYNFDFVNLHGRWFPSYAKSIRFAGKHRIRSVLTLHNGRPDGIDPLTSVAGMAYEAFYGRPVLKKVDRIIAVSQGVRDDIVRYGIPPEKFTVIHNGVDLSKMGWHAPQKRDERRGKKERQILYMGRLVKQKGLDTLIRAMKIVRKSGDVRLVIAGEGAQMEPLEKLAASLGLSDSIEFPGFVEDEKVREIYAESDLFVLPSVSEPFGMVLVEAMAGGLPCIGTDVGGIPEIIEHGRNGLIVPPGSVEALASGITELLRDDEKRERMAAEALKTARMFDWDIIAEKTERFYNEWYESGV